MPRYFIDIHDGTNVVRDKVGFPLPDLEAARDQAMQILRKIARSFEVTDQRQDFIVAVRDETGSVIFRLRMSLDAENVG